MSQFKFDAGVGKKHVTLGDQKDTTKTLMSSDGTSNGANAVSYGTPFVSLSASMDMRNFRISAEAYMQTGDTIHASNVENNRVGLNTGSVAGVVQQVGDDTILGGIKTFFFGDEVDGNAAITGEIELHSATYNIGANTLDVSQKFAVTFKGEYAFGDEDNGAAIGLGICRTADEFTYTGSKEDSSTKALGESDVNVTATIDAFDDGANDDNDDVVDDTNLAPIVLTAASGSLADQDKEVFDEGVWWFGLTASSQTQINDNIGVRLGGGYYVRSFDTSSVTDSDTDTMKLFQASTDAVMSVCNMSISFSRS